MLPDLSIRQLEYLVSVADSTSFSRAAERSGVSGSALSQGLAELERRLGIPLFDRSGRRRLARAEAQPVFDHARRVLALTADLARWAERIRAGHEGELRVGMIDASALYHHADALRRFRHDHSGLGLRLRVATSRELIDEVASGQLDLAVAVAPAATLPGIVLEPLMTEQLALYLPDGEQPGPVAGWGPWVLFPPGSHTRAVIEAVLRELGAGVEIMAESHQPEVLREMVRLGLGWTVLPVVQAEQASQPLRRARILTHRSLVTVLRAGAAPSPAIERFAQVLRGTGDRTEP